MEKICLSQRRIDEIKNVCRKYGNDPGELINILHGVQDTCTEARIAFSTSASLL